MIGKAVDDFQEYSYQFNLKIVGIPELHQNESASESRSHFLNEIGAEVLTHDIDYAYRIPSSIASSGPKPIIIMKVHSKSGQRQRDVMPKRCL